MKDRDKLTIIERIRQGRTGAFKRGLWAVPEQKPKVDCGHHLYPAVYCIRPEGDEEPDQRVYDASQTTFDENLRGIEPERIESYPSWLYEPGMTATELRGRAI